MFREENSCRHLRDGRKAERIAARYLKRRGLRLLARNYRCRVGELDLIMQEADTLVFVEVKFRRDEHWMPVIEALNRTKRRRIILTSEHYLQRQGLAPDIRECRFDLVLLVGDLRSPDIRWLRRAFDAE